MIRLNFLALLASALLATSPGKDPAKVHTVVIQGMQFQPSIITVKRGDVVTWINRDIVPHNVTEATRKAWSSFPIMNGKSWSMTVKTGASYYCSLHPVMKGKIVVK